MAVLNQEYIVINIILCNDDELETEFLKTYTDKNPAYIDGHYFNGYFYSPKPYNSWTRNNGKWEPPTPKPSSDGMYKWVEDDLNWQLITP